MSVMKIPFESILKVLKTEKLSNDSRFCVYEIDHKRVNFSKRISILS